MRRLWWRWSWRDLRARWLQVAAIALIIALGVGTSAGLTSTAKWRRLSYDASFERQRMFDIRAVVPTGTFVDADQLAAVGAALRERGLAAASAVQTEGPSQVDASSGRSTVLVPGRIVGVEARPGGAPVNRIDVVAGRGLRPGDSAATVLDEHFAARRGIAPGDRLRLSGDRVLTVVGRGLMPEHFLVLSDQGVFVSDADYAITYVSVAEAGQLLGRPGGANVLVLRTAPGVSVREARRALTETAARLLPETSFTVTDRSHDRAYRLMYDDIDGDQRLYDIFAMLILLGAAFAAFNLTARIVEAQRREIGIGMALGVHGPALAVRPMMMGLQVAALGAALGALVGLGIGALMIGLLRDLFPLPEWLHPFQVGAFARAAALGLVLPFVATLGPVWRAVRVAPVEAISTGARASRHAHRGGERARVAVSGHSIGVLPFRNVLRSPRRTILTALGIAASIAVLIGVIGMVDSFGATIDEARAELVTQSPRRVYVSLASFGPIDAAPVAAVRESPLVAETATELRLPARVRRGDTVIDLLLTVGDVHSDIWQPTIDDRRTGSGVVLTTKAIDDLGVAVGDTVDLRFPRRAGVGYEMVTEPVRVVGSSPFPLRSLAWMDEPFGLELTGLAGVTNLVVAVPRADVSTAALERALFGVPGIASTQPVTQFADSIQKELDRALGILVVVEGAVLLLALLIAFNTASINADDRAREHATMFAFGLPVRSVAGLEVLESLLVGMLGTAVGLLLGWLLLHWMVTSLLPTTVPDLGIVTYLAPSTLVLAVLMGVLAVALAPLLTVRKLLRMDIPSTLRVVE